MDDKNTDTINKDMETIFAILDEKEMVSERESLTSVIENYNLTIDKTMHSIADIITTSENLHLKITDFLFAILGAYSVYCFSAHNDIFGMIFSFSIFIAWASRDKINRIITNTQED